MSKHIIIGSRGSDLALWQAHYTRDKLQAAGYAVEIKIIKTQGDRIQHLSFDKMEGKGFFTKELEEELLAGSIDLAVHSYKDLPSIQPPGLRIAGISDRAHPADVLLVRNDVVDDKETYRLTKGAIVGTSSARRKAQLLMLRPDCQVKDIRGNVPTRIQKLRDGQFDAILMAKAGMDRIAVDLSGLHVHVFDTTQFVPAPAQGVLAFQIREEDTRMEAALQQITSHEAAAVNFIERESLRILEGGCQVPLGIFAKEEEGAFHVWCSFAESWDSLPHRLHLSDSDPQSLPQKILQNIREKSQKKVFISREQTAESLFSRLMTKRGCEVVGISMINIKPVEVPVCHPADIYCFSSRNAVRELYAQHTQLPTEKIWALGEGTAAVMREVGWVPDFVGDGNAVSIGEALLLAQPGHVVFPTATDSRSSVQEHIGNNLSWEDLIVYENAAKEDVSLPAVDIAVLTSPKNADTFFKLYDRSPLPMLVAIGQPTLEMIRQHTSQLVHVAYAPGELSLVDEVSALLH